MHLLLTAPLLIPLATAAIALLTLHQVRLQRALGMAGATAMLAATLAIFAAVYRHGVLATSLGNWPAPFGIVLVCDLFSAVMLVLAGATGFAVALYSMVMVDVQRKSFGYFPLLQVLLMGVCGAFLTGDLFNLFVWFEVLLLSSFVLLVLGGERLQIEGAIKYVTVNLISSMLFLSAVGVLYGKVGTLNMADLAVKLREADDPALFTSASLLFLTAFGIKSAIFPLFFWLPASYHTAPVAIIALFSGLLTKVGVYAMVRTFTLVFTLEPAIIHGILLPIAALTMVTGVLGAVAQYDVRRLLAFHIISQIGYLIAGLALGTTLALAAMVFFMVHVVLAKAALFFVAGIAGRIHGTMDLKRMGSLYYTHPVLAVLFLVPALSLAGLPPFPGFFAKLALVRAGIESGSYLLVATMLGVSILTLYSMVKIWNEAFWKDAPAPDIGSGNNGSPPHAGTRWKEALMYTPVALFAIVIVGLGFAAAPLFDVAWEAAGQLNGNAAYLRTVLGDAP